MCIQKRCHALTYAHTSAHTYAKAGAALYVRRHVGRLCRHCCQGSGVITARSCADVLRRGGVICRPIYEAAMQFVPDSRIKDLSVKYADLEMTLGEIDRARAIFQYGSQHSDPGKVGCERQGQRV